MNNLLSTHELLQQIARIQHMEPGKLCVIREGPEGPYYNLQCRENGKTLTVYIPRDQAEQVAMRTANHQKFQEAVSAEGGCERPRLGGAKSDFGLLQGADYVHQRRWHRGSHAQRGIGGAEG